MSVRKTWRKRVIGLLSLTVAAMLVFPAPTDASGESRPEIDIPSVRAQRLTHFSGDYAAVRQNDQYGFIDRSGTVVVEPQYDDAIPAYGVGWFVEQNEKYAFMDLNLELLTGFEFEQVGTVTEAEFTEGLLPAKKDGLWGYIDKRGRTVIPFQYEFASYFDEGVAVVEDENDQLFVINPKGEIVYEFPEHYYFMNGLLGYVLNDGVLWIGDRYAKKYGAFDVRTMSMLLEPIYDVKIDAYVFREGVAAVSLNGEYVIVNRRGERVGKLPDGGRTPYSTPFFNDGRMPVYVGGTCGYIRADGSWAVQPQYEVCETYKNGYAVVYREGRAGVIDLLGNEVIPPSYDAIGYFSPSGVAAVLKGEDIGFVRLDNEVSWTDFYSVSYFHNGYADVSTFYGTIAGIVNDRGETVYRPLYMGVKVVEASSYLNERPEDRFFPDEARIFVDGWALAKSGELVHSGDSFWTYLPEPTASDFDWTSHSEQPSEWARAEVAEAIHARIVPADLERGYTGNVTRAEFSRIVMQLLMLKTGKSLQELLLANGTTLEAGAFHDVKDQYVWAAHALGVVNGRGSGTFDPGGTLTRQEAAVMLGNAAQLLARLLDAEAHLPTDAGGKLPFSDESQIAEWAKRGVRLVSSLYDRANGKPVMGAADEERFNPHGAYTREQAYISAKRLFYAF